ncbi:MAG: hypothetical protein OQK09_04875 [Colwellia sp.]|nr:hypothetical protein [Colwellia sp.]MCW8864410.1 hypothetical protein [Colwellia sp.]MCW9080823.1 hypothetical protein [Colwellia sp.]
MNKFSLIVVIVMVAAITLVNNPAVAKKKGRGSEGAPVVYVTSQGLYYDSIVVTDLPMKGEFQQLVPTMNGLTTEYGPGEVGHLGGRWWIDVNSDGVMDSGDKFFLCPLLGPGRTTL